MVILKLTKKFTWLLTKEYEMEKKENKQTYHVHTQNKIILSGTLGKVEHYNNTCYIVILFHPP